MGGAEDGITALTAIRNRTCISRSPDARARRFRSDSPSVIENHIPVVVIVTAWDQHATESFEAGAIDYLLKPVAADRLRLSVDRAKRAVLPPGCSRWASMLLLALVGFVRLALVAALSSFQRWIDSAEIPADDVANGKFIAQFALMTGGTALFFVPRAFF